MDSVITAILTDEVQTDDELEMLMAGKIDVAEPWW